MQLPSYGVRSLLPPWRGSLLPSGHDGSAAFGQASLPATAEQAPALHTENDRRRRTDFDPPARCMVNNRPAILLIAAALAS